MGGRSKGQASIMGELLALLFLPVAWLARRVFGRKGAGPDEIRRF
jgi:hypothetical protein